MNRAHPRLLVLGWLALAIGCDNRSNKGLELAPTAPASVSAAPRSGSAKPDLALQYPDARVPVDADFEQEADSAIDASNYKIELEAIDKEIGHVPDGTTPTDTAD